MTFWADWELEVCLSANTATSVTSQESWAFTDEGYHPKAVLLCTWADDTAVGTFGYVALSAFRCLLWDKVLEVGLPSQKAMCVSFGGWDLLGKNN